eukprot:2947397-Rhodomonas_salina.2
MELGGRDEPVREEGGRGEEEGERGEETRVVVSGEREGKGTEKGVRDAQREMSSDSGSRCVEGGVSEDRQKAWEEQWSEEQWSQVETWGEMRLSGSGGKTHRCWECWVWKGRVLSVWREGFGGCACGIGFRLSGDGRVEEGLSGRGAMPCWNECWHGEARESVACLAKRIVEWHLGFGDDERSYACIPYMLKDMGIRGIQLVHLLSFLRFARERSETE